MKDFANGLLFLVSSAIAVAQPITLPDLNTPPTAPTLFAENVLSTSLNERDFAISPDGTEIYFTVPLPRFTVQTIMVCYKMKDGNWSQPEVAPFSGKFSDLEPAFSADGNSIYFASNRPVEGDKAKDFDIWKVSRHKSGWESPINLGPVVNSSSNEFYPSIAKNGNLYFTATYDHGIGLEDIFVSKWEGEAWKPPVALDTAVNSKGYEFNAFVSPDENYILFTGYGRPDDMGGGDLYISLKDGNGKWTPAKNLKAINSKQLDYCPTVSPDGKTLFFTSERHGLPLNFTSQKITYRQIKEMAAQALNGTGNIYWVDFKTVLESVE